MKPTPEEMDIALTEAKRLREQHEDNCFLGKALLNLNYRQQHYDTLLQAVERYIHSGHAEHEHTRLLKAVEQVRQMNERAAGEAHEDLGLE
jgi:hypothetical protein